MRVLLLAFLIYSPHASSYFEHSEKSPAEMNGIKFNDYRNFTSKWKLVTVRFREDSGEIRMTYANEKAFEAMRSLKPSYPDGAVFGKISFHTEGDAAFPSSKVPTDKKRFQLMVRDKKKYKDTQGWGYALFDLHGKTFNEDEKQQTQACAACHQLVEERQFVFSRSFHSGLRANSSEEAKTKTLANGIVFTQKKKNDFEGIITEHLKSSDGWVESLEGKLQKLAFSGTLDEVVPLLVERSKLMQKDALLYLDSRNFTLVRRLKASQCPTQASIGFSVLIYFNGGKVRDSEQCL